MNFFKIMLLAAILAPLPACSWIGMKNPFTSDPLTGGVNASQSNLLNIPLPAGMQSYPYHSFVKTTLSGQKEGLETYRGNASVNSAAITMFNSLKLNGWQLRLCLRKNDRSLYIYQKGQEIAAIVFHMQGMLTIMEIWAGERLPDGATLDFAKNDNEPDESIAGEEYGPIEESKAAQGTVEQWGGQLEERDL